MEKISKDVVSQEMIPLVVSRRIMNPSPSILLSSCQAEPGDLDFTTVRYALRLADRRRFAPVLWTSPNKIHLLIAAERSYFECIHVENKQTNGFSIA